MLSTVRAASAAVVALFLASCASLDATRAPGVELSKIKTAYVQKLPADERGVEKIIASRLDQMGIKATAGASESPPGAVDAIVTYQDKWMWDMTMYMLELNVQLRDGATRNVLASGKVYRPSLQRKSPEGMVEEVLDGIFGRKPQP